MAVGARTAMAIQPRSDASTHQIFPTRAVVRVGVISTNQDYPPCCFLCLCQRCCLHSFRTFFICLLSVRYLLVVELRSNSVAGTSCWRMLPTSPASVACHTLRQLAGWFVVHCTTPVAPSMKQRAKDGVDGFGILQRSNFPHSYDTDLTMQ
jgi:hypothetical protein